MARKVTFSETDARRIAAATRAYERGNRNQPPIKFRQVSDEGGDPVRIGKVAAAWDRGTCATVTIWEGGSSCEPTETSPSETIEDVANLSYNVPAESWVVIGRGVTGRWYLLDAGIGGECRTTIGGEDITRWPGWNGEAEQILGHDAGGCLKWFDVFECGGGS
jgi:hypothetical protein